MKILLINDPENGLSGPKTEYLKQSGHEVEVPTFPHDDLSQAIQICQSAFNACEPDVVVGELAGGNVAISISTAKVPLVLLRPKWRGEGGWDWTKPNSCIVHCESDEKIPYENSKLLLRNSGLPNSYLISSKLTEDLNDNKSLSTIRTVCEGIVTVPSTGDSGLVEFYTSQAHLLVNQYNNINQLLGQTTDYTAPGTHCECLVRDLLRSTLPSTLGVDKGFVHGHGMSDHGRLIHCPEIDILIHDTANFQPIFRLDDFVIVQPEAARGFIQIKRRSTASQLKKAMQNIVNAKRHMQDQLTRRSLPDYFQTRDLFGGIFFFEDGVQSPQSNRISKSYHSCIENVINSRSDRWAVPHVIHCLKGKTLVKRPRLDGTNGEEYRVFNSIDCERYLGLQGFLGELSNVLLSKLNQRRFNFPNDWKAIGSVPLDFENLG